MKIILPVLFIIISQFVFSQENITMTIVGFDHDYKLVNNKILEVIPGYPSKHIATIKGNKIYSGASMAENNVLYTVLDKCVYKTAVIADSTLLYYIKGNEIFLRTKQGCFESAGHFRNSSTGGISL